MSTRLAPVLAPYDPTAQSWMAVRKPTSIAFWMGTDEAGRDILSRIVHGARASLLAGLTSVAIHRCATGPGCRLCRRPHQPFHRRHARLPFLILVITLAAFLGPSLTDAMLAMGITATPLGLGLQPPAPSWGSVFNTAQRFINKARWMAIWPGMAIFITARSFKLLGNGLRDALDPRAK